MASWIKINEQMLDPSRNSDPRNTMYTTIESYSLPSVFGRSDTLYIVQLSNQKTGKKIYHVFVYDPYRRLIGKSESVKPARLIALKYMRNHN